MMGRTVELETVIRALNTEPGKKPGTGEMPGKGDAPAVLRDAATGSPAPLPPSPAVPPAVPPPEKSPFTVDRLRDLWPRIIENARAKSPMLGALLQGAQIAGLDGSAGSLRLLDTNPGPAAGIQRP